MKKVLLSILFFVFVGVMYGQYSLPGYGNNKKKVMVGYKRVFKKMTTAIVDKMLEDGSSKVTVIDFVDRNGYITQLSDYMRDEFYDIFYKKCEESEIDVIELNSLRKILFHNRYKKRYVLNTNLLRAIKNYTGVDVVITGKIKVLDIRRAKFYIKAVSTIDGKVLYRSSKIVPLSADMREMYKKDKTLVKKVIIVKEKELVSNGEQAGTVENSETQESSYDKNLPFYENEYLKIVLTKVAKKEDSENKIIFYLKILNKKNYEYDISISRIVFYKEDGTSGHYYKIFRDEKRVYNNMKLFVNTPAVLKVIFLRVGEVNKIKKVPLLEIKMRIKNEPYKIIKIRNIEF